MNKKSFPILSALSLSLLLFVSCASDVEESVPKAEDFSAPKIVTRTGTAPTTSCFIGLDANRALTFCYAAEREDTEGSPWEWSDEGSHLKGDNLAYLAIVMPRLDVATSTYPIEQTDITGSIFSRGILTGVAACPNGATPTSLDATQQLAKLHIVNEEGVLDNVSSLTVYLAPTATIDFAAGTLETATAEAQGFTFEWTSATKSFTLPIFPQVFPAGTALVEFVSNGETQQVMLPTETTVSRNQTLTIKFTASPSSSSPLSMSVSITDWVDAETIEGEAKKEYK